MNRMINEFREGEQIQNKVFLLRKVVTATAKNGSTYETLTLSDRTGTIDGKIWSPDDPAIASVSAPAYILTDGEITSFRGSLQFKVSRLQEAKEGTYDPRECLPSSEQDVDEMYTRLLGLVDSVKTSYFHALLDSFFRDEKFRKKFSFHSAAKSVHHGFVGGLLEHTLSVAEICEFLASHYPILDHDLLITAALCHDIGKVYELSAFPENDYTDAGQLLGHIVIGTEMLAQRMSAIPDFPKTKQLELMHCMLAHHGKLEFGSPETPELIEAIALSKADDLDAKMETMKEALAHTPAGDYSWQGYNRFLESNIRRTHPDDPETLKAESEKGASASNNAGTTGSSSQGNGSSTGRSQGGKRHYDSDIGTSLASKLADLGLTDTNQ